MAQPPPPPPAQAGTEASISSIAAQGSTNIQNRKQAVMSIHETQRQSVMKAMDARRTAAMAQAASLLDKAQGGSGSGVAEALKSGAIPDAHLVAEAAAALKVAEYLKSLISEEVGKQMAGLLAAEVQRQLAGLVADEVRRQLNAMLSEATGIPQDAIPQGAAPPAPSPQAAEPPPPVAVDGDPSGQMPSAA